MDITALGGIVAVVLLEPWTGVGTTDGIAGFASPATITVLAMFILSEGIRRTGGLRQVGNWIVVLELSRIPQPIKAEIPSTMPLRRAQWL
ncbi:MAG: SLC13 family permease [Salinibacter sp.]